MIPIFHRFRFALLLIIIGYAASPAWGQGFMVKPMRMETTPRAGETVRLPLRITNTSMQGVQSIELRVVDITQTIDGNWQIFQGGSDGALPTASGREWIKLEETRFAVPVASHVETDIEVAVPTGAQGAYFAALLAETPRPPDATGLVVRVRFLIPIIIQVQGRLVRQQVALSDLSLNYHEQQPQSPATTSAYLHVANEGRTFSRVHGNLRVELQSGDRWRPVTRIDVPERSIIPGVTLELGDDLNRRLPSGTYRMRGELWVDGRRAEPMERILELEGDPVASALAFDAALIIEPEMVRMETTPGALRTTTVSIENPGDDAVTVAMAAETPRALQGVMLGDLRGDVFSAEPWIEIRPADFVLRPGGRQNIRVISRVPRDNATHPNYYADLVLSGFYNDGQSAGVTRSMLHLTNAALDSRVQGVIDHTQISQTEGPSVYAIQVRFSNTGNIHLFPQARVEVLTGQGRSVASAQLQGGHHPLLPMGQKSFGGTIDFSGVESGRYLLRTDVILESGHRESKRLLISVEEAEGSRSVVVLDEAVLEVVDTELER